jgi:cell division protease FtsH
VLDPALVRPGRLDRKLNVYVPDTDGRKDIIEHYLKQKAHDPEIPIDLMVADSIDWTPIELKTVINEALIVAHDQGREAITYKDWLIARDTRTLGIKQPIASMSAKDKRTIAYHEAGHAVAVYYLAKEDRITKASIIRMGDAYGVVQPSPRQERHQTHAGELETAIMVSLGSRAVEELILDTKTANASSDLRHATAVAITYVGHVGMGSTLLVFPDSAMGPAPQVILLADRLLEMLYEETKRLIREKEYAVHAVANALLQKNELIGPELDEVFAYADEANPDKAGPFVRKPVVLPKMSELMQQNGANGHVPGLAGVMTGQPVPGQPGPGEPVPPTPTPRTPERPG